MSDCLVIRESMPMLLTESLDAARREQSHQHIESCAMCSAEWSAYQDTWRVLDVLPVVQVPARVRERFLASAGLGEVSRVEGRGPAETSNVVPFHRRPAARWLAQAAAVVILLGGGYYAGHRNAPMIQPDRIINVPANGSIQPISLAETRVIDAEAISPDIEGRPRITNVQFVDPDGADGEIGVAFDISSHWTVKGDPKDKSMVRLLSYMLESDAAITPRSNALDLVRRTYSDPANANPEIASALAKVLRSDEHEGVRIRAVDTLTELAPSGSASPTRDALIAALKSDPNPAVRLKAVEALANLARSGALDEAALDTLRKKAVEENENLYVRVKAAEALSNIKPTH